MLKQPYLSNMPKAVADWRCLDATQIFELQTQAIPLDGPGRSVPPEKPGIVWRHEVLARQKVAGARRATHTIACCDGYTSHFFTSKLPVTIVHFSLHKHEMLTRRRRQRAGQSVPGSPVPAPVGSGAAGAGPLGRRRPPHRRVRRAGRGLCRCSGSRRRRGPAVPGKWPSSCMFQAMLR